jgi:hypothetical protein
MRLASLINGIAGQPGKQMRYRASNTVQEALKIALPVEQAEAVEERPGVFLVGRNVHKSPIGGHIGAEPRDRKTVDQAVQTVTATICYRCGEVGHVARNCTRRRGKGLQKQVEWKDRDVPPPLVSAVKSSDFHAFKIQMRDELPVIQAEIGGIMKQFLVDSGAQDSLIQPGVHGGRIALTTATTVGVTGATKRWRGVQGLPVVIKGYVYQHSFGIMSLPPQIDGLLGMDFFNEGAGDDKHGKGRNENAERDEEKFTSTERSFKFRGMQPTRVDEAKEEGTAIRESQPRKLGPGRKFATNYVPGFLENHPEEEQGSGDRGRI